jgi:GNAT superfamily N-acetyltransferase
LSAVAPASESDGQQIVELLNEMDDFYGDTARESREQRSLNVRSLIQGQTGITVLVARVDDQLVGLAAVSLLWPAVGSSASLYLKELYVRQAWRGRGVGRDLMSYVERVARENNCSRIEFTTDVENTDAQVFYEALGYEPRPTKIFYRREL